MPALTSAPTEPRDELPPLVPLRHVLALNEMVTSIINHPTEELTDKTEEIAEP